MGNASHIFLLNLQCLNLFVNIWKSFPACSRTLSCNLLAVSPKYVSLQFTPGQWTLEWQWTLECKSEYIVSPIEKKKKKKYLISYYFPKMLVLLIILLLWTLSVKMCMVNSKCPKLTCQTWLITSSWWCCGKDVVGAGCLILGG